MSPGDEIKHVMSIVADADEGRPVRVCWTDSGMAVHGWQSRESIDPVMSSIETVGLWMGEDEEIVMIGGSRDRLNENWGECQLIWKPSISLKEWL
jgi:hypothetical protein